MNIWLLQIGETLPIEKTARKLRTAHLAEKLVEKGHTVIWWASAFDHFQKEWKFRGDGEFKVGDYTTVKYLKGTGYKKNISLSRFIDHRIISWKFKKIIKSMKKPDVIVASTPSYDLAYQAVRYAHENNIPILIDVRDLWPDIFVDQFPLYIRSLLRLFLFREFQMIRYVMKHATAIISMMEPLLDWGLHYAGRERTWKDMVFYLGGKKANPIKKDLPSQLQFLDGNKNFIVAFVGTFASYHNPSILVECAEKMKGSNVHFVLAGGGEDFEEVKKKALNCPNVHFPGWLNDNQIYSLLERSHVGICPSSSDVWFFPNKVFSYFALGLPVISAFKGDLKELLLKHNIGYYYRPNDVQMLVEHIQTLAFDKPVYQAISGNVKRLFPTIFDSDVIYDRYANHIEKVV